MTSAVRWSILWVVGGVTSLLIGYIYGFLSAGFDMFVVFPFVVAALIFGITLRITTIFQLPAGSILLLSGACFGFLAYSAHVVGAFHAFSQHVYTEAQSLDPTMTVNQAMRMRDAFLQSETPFDGILGYVLYHFKGSLAFLPSAVPRAGNYIEGSFVELVKLGILVGVCSVALRDVARFEAKYPPQVISRNETTQHQRQFLRIIILLVVIVGMLLLIFWSGWA